METVVGAVASLVGVLVGAALASVASGRQRRLAMTFELHRELHSTEMIRARHAAADLLAQYKGQDYKQIQDQIGALAMRDVHQVIFFFQRLWLAIEHKALKNEYITRLFGDTFSWWYQASFRAQLVPTHTEVGSDIEALWTWMQQHSTRQQRELWRRGEPSDWAT